MSKQFRDVCRRLSAQRDRRVPTPAPQEVKDRLEEVKAAILRRQQARLRGEEMDERMPADEPEQEAE